MTDSLINDSTRHYAMPDDLEFDIVTCPFLSNNVPPGPWFIYFIGQKCFTRCWSNNGDFKSHHTCLIDQALPQSYKV